uniref:Putative secreted protein n=1 Tax=Rhipicephalus microplus TaxID=6941 RepID=A0A6M2DAX1_RHIMP
MVVLALIFRNTAGLYYYCYHCLLSIFIGIKQRPFPIAFHRYHSWLQIQKAFYKEAYTKHLILSVYFNNKVLPILTSGFAF